MKKLFLLLAAGVVVVSANAQQLTKHSITNHQKDEKVASRVPTLDNNKTYNMTEATSALNKTTTGGSRWYSFVDNLIQFGSDPTTNFGASFMINSNHLLSYFGSATGYDTVFMNSFASVMDPTAANFNDAGLIPQLGGSTIGVTNNDAYTLDSVRVYGNYVRSASKPSVVDTLRIAILYGGGSGTNIPIYYFTGMAATYGYDTVRFGEIFHDTVKNIALKNPAASASVLVKDVYLTAASVNDTVSDPNSNYQGLNVFTVSAGSMAIPANQFVGASVTFISGDNITAWDTLQTSTPTVKYNYWRAYFFTQNPSSPRSYYPGEYNVGLTKYNDHFDPPGSSWRGFYVPSYAYNGAVWHENPLIDYKVTCATCKSLTQLGVNDVTAIGNVSSAYPNPSSSVANITFTVKEASTINVSITNSLGQVVKSQNLGRFNANQNGKATFNVNDLASGVYFYTVDANGQKVTKRLVVTH